MTETRVSTFAGRLGMSPRKVQLALGVLWIIDALLQYQPRMWGADLVSQMISPMAARQPAPVAWGVHTAAQLIRPDPGAWNFLFASLQLVIGIGLLIPRTVKQALCVMFVWAFGVWWVGEGFGQLLTARTSPLVGAPGAVLLYALIGMLAWPNDKTLTAAACPAPRPVDGGDFGDYRTSAAAVGRLGVPAGLAMWAGLWGLFAVLWLLPANRSATSIHDSLIQAASGEPGWYSHFLKALAGGFRSGGPLGPGSSPSLPWSSPSVHS
jgi:hypothetical protein